MIVNQIDRLEFLQMFEHDRDGFMARIDEPQAFVVQQFYPRESILRFRAELFQKGLESEASWHPLKDECPDYHRLHDNYKNAYVKTKMHTFYLHGWKEENRAVFDTFREIFAIKNGLAGFKEDEFISNRPSDGVVARVLVHHYPPGGGYQEEHVDPVADFAKLQTLIAGSQFGKDFEEGGLYAKESPDGDRVYLDSYTEPGDLILLSPGIHHGVAPVDPSQQYDWQSEMGRWIVLPIMLHSDYAGTSVTRPKGVA